jgi:hypothetical protein
MGSEKITLKVHASATSTRARRPETKQQFLLSIKAGFYDVYKTKTYLLKI